MASQLPSSLLASAAANAGVARPDAGLVMRRNDAPNGGDDFAQVFATTQEAQQPQSRNDFKSDDTAPARTNEAAPKARPSAKARKSDDGNKDDSAKETNTSDETGAPKDKSEAKHVGKSEKKDGAPESQHKHCKKSEETCSEEAVLAVTPDEKTAAANSASADAADATADAGGAPADAKPDAGKAVCFAPVLKAQEETNAANASGGDEGQEQEAAPAKLALPDLLSFRANPLAGDAPAASKPLLDASAGLPAVKTEAKAKTSVTINGDVKTPSFSGDQEGLKPFLTVENKKVTVVVAKDESVPAQPQADVNADFSAALQHAQTPKADKNPQGAAPEAQAANDDAVSPTPPAAGSRVNAQMGFSAPTPTGSGSGSPPALKAASGSGVEATAPSGVAAANARMEAGADFQIVKTARAAGVPDMPVMAQLSMGLSRAVKDGGSRFEVQLSPADLGKVEIRMDIAKDGTVRATVTCDNPSTHDMLQKDSRAMEKVFQDAGLQTDSNSLSFNLREQTRDQQMAQPQAPKAWQRWMDNTLSAEADSDTQFYTAAPGRVDMRV